MAEIDQKKLCAVIQRRLDSLDLCSEEEAIATASAYAASEPGEEFLVVEVVVKALTPASENQGGQ